MPIKFVLYLIILSMFICRSFSIRPFDYVIIYTCTGLFCCVTYYSRCQHLQLRGNHITNSYPIKVPKISKIKCTFSLCFLHYFSTGFLLNLRSMPSSHLDPPNFQLLAVYLSWLSKVASFTLWFMLSRNLDQFREFILVHFLQ